MKCKCCISEQLNVLMSFVIVLTTYKHKRRGNVSVIKMQVMQQPGSLERVLRVIRHRGFSLLDLSVNGTLDNQIFSLMVMVSGERPLSFLTKQLNKLIDVSDLKVSEKKVSEQIVNKPTENQQNEKLQAFNEKRDELNGVNCHYASTA